MTKIIEITSQEQFKSTLDSTPGPVVVLYTAPAWCGPCQRLEPEFNKLADMTDATLVRVDIDHNEWVRGLQHVPTIHYYRDHEYKDELYPMGAEAFAATLDAWE